MRSHLRVEELEYLNYNLVASPGCWETQGSIRVRQYLQQSARELESREGIVRRWIYDASYIQRTASLVHKCSPLVRG